MTVLDYHTIGDARTHLKDVYDAAAHGATVRLARNGEHFALAREDLLRRHFANTVAPQLRVGLDDDRWVASMDARPFVAEGIDADDAIAELVTELREYATEYDEHYAGASNHADLWALVLLVRLSSDAELGAWLRSDP